MNFVVNWSLKSKADYFEIIDYLIDNWGRNSAKKFKETLMKSLNLISIMPYIYTETEFRENVRRCIVVKQVSMYYKVIEDKNEILIIRFFDNRRNPDVIEEELDNE